MNASIVIGKLDRGLRGELTATLHNDSAPYVAFRHMERAGREGGRLIVKIEEIETLSKILHTAQAVAGGSKSQHRTVHAESLTQKQIELQLEEDAKLF
jgi:hypothetical protein